MDSGCTAVKIYILEQTSFLYATAKRRGGEHDLIQRHYQYVSFQYVSFHI
jgi:hypothetical protein